jgi:hypothetical protein
MQSTKLRIAMVSYGKWGMILMADSRGKLWRNPDRLLQLGGGGLRLTLGPGFEMRTQP